MFALRCGGHLLYEGCGTRRSPQLPGSAKTRVVIDAIVSTKTFRNATLREKSFSESLLPSKRYAGRTFRTIQIFSRENFLKQAYAHAKRNLCKISSPCIST